MMKYFKSVISGLLVAATFISACATFQSHQAKTPGNGKYIEEGVASWYGRKFQGRRTASGERYNQNAMTCAHRTLPFGSWIRVTNLNNQEEVMVKVTDRGPFVFSRVIDLSREAAKRLGFHLQGTALVRLESAEQGP